jgi:hypothetical protein
MELPTLPARIEFGGKTMVLKPESHVTVVGFAAKLDKRFKEAAAARGEKLSNSQAGEGVAEALKKAAEDLQFKVQMGADSIEVPPIHVTVYTLENGQYKTPSPYKILFSENLV